MEQRLALLFGGRVVLEFGVSSSRFGTGNRDGSGRTPLGLHRIVEKVGEGEPPGRVFRNRKSTGEIMTAFEDGEDAITTRILRLEGLEEGLNRGPGIDSFDRCIYIHGTSDEESIGRPASVGCIRMNNADVVELFDRVRVGTKVLIVETEKGIEHGEIENHGR
jgi:hypothetical protein